jgi:hypothetical protein
LQDAAENFFQIVKLSRALKAQEREIVHRILKNNFFSAHPESVLLGLLTHQNIDHRKLALTQILKARQLRKDLLVDSSAVRKFVCPISLNFDAECFANLIDWNDISNSITEPPLTLRYSKRDLLNIVEKNTPDFCEYPNHTQAVERMVKLVTQSSLMYASHDKRHYFILNSLKALK